MVSVTKATIRANIFEVLYDLLVAQLSAGTVTAAFIDTSPTFPQVVINPAAMKIEKLTFRKDNKEYLAEIEIEIYTKKNKEIDTISDEITSDLETYESTLASANLYLEDIDDSNEDTFYLNDQKIHIKTMLITFKANV